MDDRTRDLREELRLEGFLQLETRLEGMGVLEEVKAMAWCHGVTLEEVYGPSRILHVVRARHEVWRFMRRRFRWSYPAIGVLFNRDHTTIMMGIRKAEENE